APDLAGGVRLARGVDSNLHRGLTDGVFHVAGLDVADHLGAAGPTEQATRRLIDAVSGARDPTLVIDDDLLDGEGLEPGLGDGRVVRLDVGKVGRGDGARGREHPDVLDALL